MDGDWGNIPTLRILTKRPYEHLGVLITWPAALIRKISAKGPRGPDDVRPIGDFLNRSLVPA